MTIVIDGQDNQDAAWYYPDPKPVARRIKGYVAFWRGVEVVKDRRIPPNQPALNLGRRALCASDLETCRTIETYKLFPVSQYACN